MCFGANSDIAIHLGYQPAEPKSYRPRIGLIGCGWVTEYQLKAYKHAGYDVVALCDCYEPKAIERQKQFYPAATVCTDAHQLLSRDDIDVVDIATHPAERVALIEAALNAGKHVLSQKPFVLDLDEGERLVALARKRNRKLAVNQNGRWAPHWSYLRASLRRLAHRRPHGRVPGRALGTIGPPGRRSMTCAT